MCPEDKPKPVAVAIEKDLVLKSGTVFRKGTVFEMSPGYKDAMVILNPGPLQYKVRYTSVFEVPSIEQLHEWNFDSVCETPLENQVEPDGTDEHGFPSWRRILGFI